MYDSLYGRATRSTHPRLTQHTVETGTSIYQARPTSATRNDHPAALQQLDRPQFPATILQLHPTTRPTSASRYNHPASFYDSTDGYPHQTSTCISTTRPTPAALIEHPAAHIYNSTIPSNRHHPSSWIPKYNRHGLYTRACKHNKWSSLLYLLPRLCFLQCLWLSLLARFNLKHLRGRRAYRLRNRLILISAINLVNLF